LFQPETYAVALSFMVITMLCWGSWANALKLCPGYRFQLFYWDYAVGLIVGALVWGFTLGSFGSSGKSFLLDIAAGHTFPIVMSLCSGVIFNAANLLLVAAIEIAGLAVAFPIGIGLALIIGAVSSYILLPNGNPILLFGGIILIIAAIIFDAAAYWLRETQPRSLNLRGVMISLAAGVLMGCFYPFLSKAMTGTTALGPYGATFFFVIGVAASAIPLNYMLMRHPLDGNAPVSMDGYRRAPHLWHLWGVVGGIVWCTGTVLNLVASRAHIIGPAVSYSIGQGATMVSAAWGVFVWREFSRAPDRSKKFLLSMFAFFLCGLSSIALAPILWR
jgi:glucose uptake protein